MAIGELKCSSLDYVYRMTWAEFELRLFSFNRSEKREEYKLRRQAWITYISPYQNPKKLRGMTESKFWNISGDKPKQVTEAHKKRFLEKYQEYLLKKAEHGRA